MKRGIVCLLTAAVLVAHGTAGAQGGGRGPGSPGASLEQSLKRLDLKPEQKAKVQAILDGSKKEREDLQTQIHQAYKELRGMLDQESPDEQAILRQADKIGGLKTQQQKAMLRTLLKVRAELTPEQRQQLTKLQRHAGPARAGGAKEKPSGATPAPTSP
jgi:Spy/CpxP family protein refolding chaperone